MKTNKFYTEFTKKEIAIGKDFMTDEMNDLEVNHPIRQLFALAWQDFKDNKFKYDGATFVKERSLTTAFEVASFIHDWRNSMGYVSKAVDEEFVSIMIALNYTYKLIFERYLLLKIATPINIVRHKLLRNYKKSSNINLYNLNK